MDNKKNTDIHGAFSSVLEKINQVKKQLEYEKGTSVSIREAMEEMNLPPKFVDDLEKAIKLHYRDQF